MFSHVSSFYVSLGLVRSCWFMLCQFRSG